jgi:hypothetical protein
MTEGQNLHTEDKLTVNPAQSLNLTLMLWFINIIFNTM